MMKEKYSLKDLDKTDLKLLSLLSKDCRLTTKELAAAVNLSATPVHERIKKLDKQGYIKSYIARINCEQLNLGLMVFCNITLKQHSKEIGHQFVKDITALKQVVSCYNVSGDYDFLLQVLVKDMKAYQNFVLNDLGSIDNIGSAHSTFVMGTILERNGIDPIHLSNQFI